MKIHHIYYTIPIFSNVTNSLRSSFESTVTKIITVCIVVYFVEKGDICKLVGWGTDMGKKPDADMDKSGK